VTIFYKRDQRTGDISTVDANATRVLKDHSVEEVQAVLAFNPRFPDRITIAWGAVRPVEVHATLLIETLRAQGYKVSKS
jgi:hypothetical protein